MDSGVTHKQLLTMCLSDRSIGFAKKNSLTQGLVLVRKRLNKQGLNKKLSFYCLTGYDIIRWVDVSSNIEGIFSAP